MTSSFTWRDVTYGVGTGKKSKEILKGISGSLTDGEVCAILGPSGSGKTSLLNVLARRIRDKGAVQRVGGDVLLDGRELTGSSLRKRIAYVMQQDFLFATQTPREALLFSAMLRLPQTMPMAEKRELVEKMLGDLGLLACADTYCGDDMIRGISGGEKKRTAIGIELVMKPSLIFLDEPTSGLDSFSAQSVCRKLTELGKTQGCNILCTIHQPASEVFHTFSKVLLLYKGKDLYYGAIKGFSSGLAQHNFACPNEYNLADHAITLTQTLTIEELDKLRAVLLGTRDGGYYGGNYASGGGHTTIDPVLATEMELSPKMDTDAKLSPKVDVDVAIPASTSKPTTEHAPSHAGFCTQLYALSRREMQYVWRNKPGLIASIVAPLVLNTVFACIFYQVGDNSPSNSEYTLQGHFGAATQVLIGGMFGAAQPLLLRFPLDRGIFLREYATSTYSSLPYFLSKTMVELPQQFLNAVLVWVAYYWLTGMQGSWILHVIVFWLSGVAAASTALLVGCLAANPEVAVQSAPPIFVLQLLFVGVFLPTAQIPLALRWIQWISSLKYSINLTQLIEFGEATQTANNWTDAERHAADFLLERNEVDPEDWWLYLVMLVVLIIAFRTVAVVALARRAAAFF